MKKFDYQPLIFGTLCEKECKSDPVVARGLRKAVGDSVMLPFSVESRHLKNVVLTMRLMDIAGLAINGRHRKTIMKYLSSKDGSAKNSGSADIVIRNGKSLKGFNSVAIACTKWLEDQGTGKGRAVIVGKHDDAEVVSAALTTMGFRISRPRTVNSLGNARALVVGKLTASERKKLESALRDMPAKPVTIDLSGAFTPKFRVPRLGRRDLEKRIRQTRVELLTSAAKGNLLK